jgi:RNA polymerase sigma-70 factor (ECF subfamily)
MYFEGNSQLKDLENPQNKLSSEELMEKVNQSIKKLPEDLRVALTLREYDGMSYEEIADVMGCPVGTVRSRIFRARETVEQAIKPLLDHTEVA